MKKTKRIINKMRIVGFILVFAIALTNISAFAFLSEKAGIDIICNNKEISFLMKKFLNLKLL